MDFYMPVKVFNGEDVVKAQAAAWTALGTKALIVTGKSSAVNGSKADVIAALEAYQKEYVIFDETEENPSIEMVMKVRDMGIQEQVDFVIGVGGGSPMDAAKAIALMIYHKDKGAEYLYQTGSDEALPMVAVPTTCGTGAEVTPNAVLTIHAKRTKASMSHKIYPDYALIDWKYLKSAGRTLLINTAVDALGHLIESYVNTARTEYSAMVCEHGMNIWSSIKNVLIGAEITDEQYENLMLASTMAGMAIAQTGTTLPHALSYYLTYEKHTHHGKAVGYFLPGYLQMADSRTRRKVLSLIGFPDMQYFTSFMHKLLGKMDVEEELIREAVCGVGANTAKLKSVPYEVTEEVLYKICEAAR